MNKELSNKIKIVMKRNGSLRSCAFYETAAAINIGLSFFTEKISVSSLVFNIFTLLTVGVNYVKALTELENDKYREEHKEEYEELKDLYDKYMNDLCDVIKKYKFDDELQLCILLDYLLYEGRFSLNNEFTYKIHEKTNEYFTDLLGTFVITGSGVCRHTTEFMINLLSKLNVNCFEILCSSEKNGDINHALVGLISNGKKYCYDFTNHFCGLIKDKYIYAYPGNFKAYKIRGISLTKKEYKDTTSREITDKMILNCLDKMDNYDNNLIFELCNFSFEHKKEKEEITNKTLKLMPRK